MSHTVLIVRKRLLPYTETFVAAQATHLPHWRPVFAGIARESSGVSLLDGYPVCLQNEIARVPSLARAWFSTLGRPDPQWIAAIREHQPSLVHAHFGPAGWYGLSLGQALDLPVVVTFHGYDITQHAIDRRYRRQRERVFREADRIVAVSDFIRQKLIDAGCPADKVVRHYIGVDTTGDPAADCERAAEPRIVFVGRLVRQKGGAELLDAFRHVQQQVPNAQLDIIGEGPELATLQQRADQLTGVNFLGRLTPAEVRTAMRRAWVLCNPGIVDEHGAEEGLGLVFVEAQAQGTPAVSFDTGGVSEAIVDQQTGFVVTPGNTVELADRLVQLVSNERLRVQLGQAAREHVLDHFDLSKQCVLLEQHYASVLGDMR